MSLDRIRREFDSSPDKVEVGLSIIDLGTTCLAKRSSLMRKPQLNHKQSKQLHCAASPNF